MKELGRLVYVSKEVKVSDMIILFETDDMHSLSIFIES
jgi:hypothetical protein